MSVLVKICGLSTEETVDAAVEAGADLLGFNFFPRSPRFVELERAVELAERARGKAAIVALTVDMDSPALSGIVERLRPDWLQLHGKEPPERVTLLRQRFAPKVMKALGISTADDVAATEPYARAADALLLDAKPPKGADRPGGNAVSFDWHLLDGFDPGRPWLLSGGLDPQNVADAIGIAAPPGVDVSSGVESAPGRKEPDLIRAFVRTVRKAEEKMAERPRMAS